jgi:hypothetical protein
VKNIKVKLISTVQVSEELQYNAFSDLVVFEGKFWIAYRTGAGHVSPFGQIIIRNSTDGQNWVKKAQIKKDNFDLRDPRLSIINNKITLLAFSLDYINKTKHRYKYNAADSYIYQYNSQTDTFDEISIFNYQKHQTTLWSIQQFKDTIYVGGYLWKGARTEAIIWKSTNIIGPWTQVTILEDDMIPPDLCYNEFDMVNVNSNKMTLFLRVDGYHWKRLIEKKAIKNAKKTAKKEWKNAPLKPHNLNNFSDWLVVAHASKPFEKWEYYLHRSYLKGPRAIYHPSGEYFFVGRTKDTKSQRNTKREITLFQYNLENNTFTPLYTFAEGRDGSYAGLHIDQEDDSILYVSFYSDHNRRGTNLQGKVNDIWFSKLKIEIN